MDTDKAYKRDDFNIGNVNIYYAGIVAFLAGIYFFVTSF